MLTILKDINYMNFKFETELIKSITCIWYYIIIGYFSVFKYFLINIKMSRYY